MPPSRSELVRLIAPCGLHCGGCLAFAGGPIRNHARALRDLLGPNFGAYAERFAMANPAFARYPDFAALLEHLSAGTCRGCREGGCLLGNCGVRECALKHEQDFCGLCPQFPCENPGLPEGLVERWRKNGELLRDKGPAAFLDLLRLRPRYP
jgi:hypothetical protein